MSDNYQSPYGFGILTDAVLDHVAARHDMTTDQLAVAMQRLSEDVTSELDTRIQEYWWRDYMGVAVDKLDDLLSEYIDLDIDAPGFVADEGHPVLTD